MIQLGPYEFREVVLADFEFQAPPGERPTPVCLVARELGSGRIHRLWQDDLQRRAEPPYPVGSDCLFVAYYASAELGCHLALGWHLPVNVLDLFAEFRTLTNGRPTPHGAGLLGALTYFRLDAMAAAEKEGMRDLALRGGPWTNDERAALLQYCESDVVALGKLLDRLRSRLDMPRALIRGRYMKAAARMEEYGVPIDTTALSTLRDEWSAIQDGLIARVDAGYRVYEGRTFKRDRFVAWLAAQRIPWPRLASGQLNLEDDTFRQMARAYPILEPLRQLRVSLSQLRLHELPVGQDGRNRCLLSAFRATTGRNQPSNSKYIFGPAAWLRHLIRPEPGCGLAYVDWSQQEFGIAAALSRDPAMLAAYESGDPYLTFAKQAGAVPPDATKATHGAVREQFKQCALGVQYGMGPQALAQGISQPTVRARELLELHRDAYRRFWSWSDAAVDHAMGKGFLFTTFGWTYHTGSDANPRMLRNFPMQANGAEMLRLACCFATERGITVCAPVHDALLIEAPLAKLDQVVTATQQAMADASAVVLDGFRLRSDAKVIRYPDRYTDERGGSVWKTVWEIIDDRRAHHRHEGAQPGHDTGGNVSDGSSYAASSVTMEGETC